MNNPLIKEAVKKYKSEGLSILSKWDAGGDECICIVKIGEKENILYAGIDITEELSELIIRKLDLPDAGEIHHNGEGFIDINEQEQVFILFSAEFGYYSYLDEYYNEETGELLEIEEKLENIIYSEEIEDAFGLRKWLHKAEIEFSGRVNREGETETSIQVEVFQGDEIQISAEQKAFYEEIIKKQLLKALEEMKKEEQKLKKSPKDKLFASINLKAYLTSEPKVVFTLSPSANHFENFVEEVVILIE